MLLAPIALLLTASPATRFWPAVMTKLAQGLSTNDIAQSLSITSATVRNHIRNLLQKLHVHNRLEAVVYAFKQGLVDKE